MKNLIVLMILLLCPLRSMAMYDFCESPSDYNIFPAAYDVRTEYWRDIPNYHKDDIKYENIEPDSKQFFKSRKKPKKEKGTS